MRRGEELVVQVDEMEKAVDVAEKNMSRFGLTQAEISNRRKWVMQTRRQVSSLEIQQASCQDLLPACSMQH